MIESRVIKQILVVIDQNCTDIGPKISVSGKVWQEYIQKKFLTLECPKKIFYSFLDVRKKFFSPLNGTLTEIFFATGGWKVAEKNFAAGHHQLSQGNLADTPPPN
jgi:hypothetical protein